MPLHSKGRRERIIVFGDYGSGKSQTWVDWAKMLRDTGSDSKVHVICSDMGAEASLEQHSGWEANVSVVDVQSFDDYCVAVRDRRGDNPDDLLVIDRVDSAWDAVQDSFSLDVSGKDLDDWAVERLRAGQESPFSDGHGVSWGIIKRRYREKFVGHWMRYPGHVLLCAASKDVVSPNSAGKGGDPQEVRDFYGRQGVRPAGEKNTGFLMHDVVLLGRKGEGNWIMSTIRTRSREVVVSQKVGNFVVDYLMGVGGWVV